MYANAETKHCSFKNVIFIPTKWRTAKNSYNKTVTDVLNGTYIALTNNNINNNNNNQVKIQNLTYFVSFFLNELIYSFFSLKRIFVRLTVN